MPLLLVNLGVIVYVVNQLEQVWSVATFMMLYFVSAVMQSLCYWAFFIPLTMLSLDSLLIGSNPAICGLEHVTLLLLMGLKQQQNSRVVHSRIPAITHYLNLEVGQLPLYFMIGMIFVSFLVEMALLEAITRIGLSFLWTWVMVRLFNRTIQEPLQVGDDSP